MIEINKIYNEDCLETMARMGDKSIDLTMADFPYGINLEYDKWVDTRENLIELVNKTMPEILRVSKRVFITCGHSQVWLFPESRWILAWVYGTTQQRNSWGFTSWQPILAYGKDPYLANGMGARMDIIKDSIPANVDGHPCAKPITFWIKLLMRGSVKDTDLIYDPFMGSGTTAMACIKTGRNYIGSEISPKYCEIAEKRIKQELSQLKLPI